MLIYLKIFLSLFFIFLSLFIIPWAIFIYLYLQSLFCHVYKRIKKLDQNLDTKEWQYARKIVANLWMLHGSFVHGYEIVGIENIPLNKPAIVILYHGSVPVDLYYLVTLLILHPQIKISVIGDRFLFNVKGLPLLMNLLNVRVGSFESCCRDLQEGRVLFISPGGAREAAFSDDYYTLIWNKRSGFAKIALSQNVPVIPAFTQNIREAYNVATFGYGKYFRDYYEKRRIPLLPLYGGFPVKLKTIFGKPLYPQDVFGNSLFSINPTSPESLGDSGINNSPDSFKIKTDNLSQVSLNSTRSAHHYQEVSPDVIEYAKACKAQLENLIKSNQHLPKSLWRALLQRFTDNPFAFTYVNSNFNCKYFQTHPNKMKSKKFD